MTLIGGDEAAAGWPEGVSEAWGGGRGGAGRAGGKPRRVAVVTECRG